MKQIKSKSGYYIGHGGVQYTLWDVVYSTERDSMGRPSGNQIPVSGRFIKNLGKDFEIVKK